MDGDRGGVAKGTDASAQTGTDRATATIRSMTEAQVVLELCYDGDRAVDFRFVEVNPAYEAITGLNASETIGRTGRDLFPEIAAAQLPMLARIDQTRTAERFEDHVAELDRYFDVVAFSSRPGEVTALVSETTDRKKAETELRESEERLAALFERAPLGYQSLDEDGRFIDVNEAWLELLGFTREEVIGRWFGDFLAPEFVEAFRDRFPLFKERGVIHSEFVMMHRDGSRHFIAFDGRIGRNPDGTFRQTHCILADITERECAAAEMQESQARLQAILDNTPSLIYVKDLEGRFTLANREFEQRLGTPGGTVLGMTSHDLIEDSMADTHWVNDLEVIRSGQPITAEEEANEQDGRHEFISVKFPLFDTSGGVIGVCGISTDVTAHKAVEHELERRNAFIETVIENAPIGYGVNRISDGATVLISGNFERIYGVEPHTIQGVEDFFERVYLDPVVRERMRSRIMTDMASGDPARLRWTDIPVLQRDGGMRYVTAVNIPLPDQDLMISAVEDVTARHLAEAEVAEQRERLDRMLDSVIDVVGTIVETRDPYTAGHQRRVAQIATAIAAELGMDERDIADIRVAGLIHDVGKIQVPVEILGKPGRISNLEFDVLRVHPETGYRIVTAAHLDEPMALMVYEHHERCDGSGYPRGLTADEILPGAKVLAVADVVEAMMSNRPYRPALGLDAALEEIESGRGTKYDAAASDACLRIFREGRIELD